MASFEKRWLMAAPVLLGMTVADAQAQTAVTAVGDADARATAIEARMTDAERLNMVRSTFARTDRTSKPLPHDVISSASYTAAIPRLGIPALRETDGPVGVSWVSGSRKDGATAFPATIAIGATWDPTIAYRAGALMAREARAKGFNVLLDGGVNLMREPRGGRNFEYVSEDPLLAGVIGGEGIRGVEDGHVLSTVKHFAFNAQETGRHIVNAVISETAAHDSDLLAFRIAIDHGRPGAVMCAYNRYNGPQACGSRYLLTDVLKGEWGYPGFVMSDWSAVRGIGDMRDGLDRESAEELDGHPWFAQELPQAMATDPAMKVRVRDAARRVVRSMIASGLFDDPPVAQTVDPAIGRAIAKDAASASIVLLKNDGVLPLLKTAQRIAIIGGYANAGVISGGGSSQAQPVEGPAINMPGNGTNHRIMFHPSPPLAAIVGKLPKDAFVRYDQGFYPATAADLARDSDVVIVFATQWMSEGLDAPDLSLPQGQDAMIEAVARANPHTIVVLETGGPVLMPWKDKVAGIVEAWYSGIGGGPAIADVLFGDADAAGRLPVTFPASLAQLPRPKLDDSLDTHRDFASQTQTLKSFDVNYNIEGADVGYRWFARRKMKPLYPFGYGLSYTHFQYTDFSVSGQGAVTASFTITNDGTRAGSDVPQVYVTDRAGKHGLRLVGWQKVALGMGETRRVSVVIEPKVLADWDPASRSWRIEPGKFAFQLGASSENVAARASATLVADQIK